MLRVAAVIAVAAAATLTAPAQAAAPTDVTIRASRDASMTLRLRTPITVYNGASEDGAPGPTINGGGAHAGFLLLPSKRSRPSVGRIWIGEGDSRSHITAGDAEHRLPAGNYTLHVVADEPVTITLPVTGSVTRSWRPTGGLKVTTTPVELAPPVGSPISGTEPVRLTERTVLVVVVDFAYTGTSAYVDLCLTAKGTCRHWIRSRAVIGMLPGIAKPIRTLDLGDRGELPLGEWTLYAAIQAAVAVSQASVTALLIG